MFLVVIDMDDESAAQEPPRGFGIRAWFGIKLVCHCSSGTHVHVLMGKFLVFATSNSIPIVGSVFGLQDTGAKELEGH